MPKYPNWRNPNEPQDFGNEDFTRVFGIKTGFGPRDATGKPKWNRCWFHMPQEWVSAVTKLINDIKAKYVVETVDDLDGDPKVQVAIQQVKCKFGELRFYFSAENSEIYADISKMVAVCEEQLKKDDPTYGVPY